MVQGHVLSRVVGSHLETSSCASDQAAPRRIRNSLGIDHAGGAVARVNRRYVWLPLSIALMLLALLFSLGLVTLDALGIDVSTGVEALL